MTCCLLAYNACYSRSRLLTAKIILISSWRLVFLGQGLSLATVLVGLRVILGASTALATRAVTLVVVLNWGDTIVVDLLLVLWGLIILLLLIEPTPLLCGFVLITAVFPVIAPLTMELTLGIVPVGLLGLVQVVVVLPPELPFLCLALLPVRKACQVGLDLTTPCLPVRLEVLPATPELANGYAEEMPNGDLEALGPGAETMSWARVWELLVVGVRRGVIAFTVARGLVALVAGGVAVVMLGSKDGLLVCFAVVFSIGDLVGVDYGSDRDECEKKDVLHV